MKIKYLAKEGKVKYFLSLKRMIDLVVSWLVIIRMVSISGI